MMTVNMVAGCAIVISAGAFTLWRESRLGKVPPPPIEPPGAL